MPAPQVQTGVYGSTDHNALAAYIDTTKTGVVGYGNRNSDKTGITAESPILRVDGIQLVAGKRYRVSTTSRPVSTVPTDTWSVRLRMDTTGAAATVASTQLGGIAGGTSNSPHCNHFATYAPTSNVTASVLVTLARGSGTGTFGANIDLTLELIVEDIGADPGDTGIDL